MIKKISTSIVFGMGALTTSTAMAADVKGNVVTQDQVSQIPYFMAMKDIDQNGLPKSYSATEVLEQLSSHKGLANHAPDKISTKGPASGISYFEVGFVYSSNVGLEQIGDGQFSTMSNHGGSQLFVYVWQYGYGNPNNGTLNGISKPPGLSQYRCGSDLHVCRTGETVTGWLYGWDFSGQQGGFFQASANSTAYPVGQYWSDSISIL